MFQTIKRLAVPNLFSAFVVILLAANYFAPFGDLDFTWQIRTGQQIVESGQLRTPDTFTYTIAGRDVPDFEWLYEVILWGVWSAFGFGGLKLVKTGLVILPLLLVCLRLRSEGMRWHGIALSALFAILVLSPAWNLRPLYCTTIGLLMLWGFLHDHCTGRRPLSWWLPVVMLLWANLHPGIIVGQGLLAGAIGWEWMNRLLRLNCPLSRTGCVRLTVIGGLGLAATFLSPDPVERLLYPFRPELAHPIQRIIVEMQPLASFLFRSPYIAGPVYVLAALVAVSVVARFRQYRLWEICLLVGLTLLANVAVRSLQDWVLIMLALGVPHIAALGGELRERRRSWNRSVLATGLTPTFSARPVWTALLRVNLFCRRMLRAPAFQAQLVWPATALVVLAAVSLVPSISRRMPVQDSSEWPTAALNWIETQQLSGRFFGPPDYGSYVGWRLGARGKSYVDTRTFFFSADLLEDSHFVPQLGPDWRHRLDRIIGYGTTYFLLETTGPRGALWTTLKEHVDQPLYCDQQAVLLSAEQVSLALARLEGTSPTLATSTK